MLTKQEKTQLQKIQELAYQMKNVYEAMDVDTQEYIRQYHNNETNTPNSIWAIISNTDELVEKVQTVYEEGTKFNVKKDIDFGSGYVPKDSKAVLTQVYKYGRFSDEEPAYQFDFDTFVAHKPEDEADGWCEDLNVQDVRDYLQKD